MKRLNRRQLRRIIINEISTINETEDEFNKFMDYLKNKNSLMNRWVPDYAEELRELFNQQPAVVKSVLNLAAGGFIELNKVIDAIKSAVGDPTPDLM